MMVDKALAVDFADDSTSDDSLFSRIAGDLLAQGYCIRPVAMPPELMSALNDHRLQMDAELFSDAGIGRRTAYLRNDFVRTNEICWITGTSEAGRQWIHWARDLQTYLNRRLFLGLFSFESHFAHYRPGDYYKRHYDAFRGERNRVLSIVVYLNPGWAPDHGGELVLYRDELDREGIRVVPLMGTVVAFLSEEFPHEVLPTQRDRYSIAGWYRVNTSIGGVVDPPR